MASNNTQYNKIVNNTTNVLQNNNNVINDNRCTICLEIKTEKSVVYYKCTKQHNICKPCHKEYVSANINSARNGKCPTCDAGLINEFKEPAKLSMCEIIKLATEKIQVQNIYIHQNFRLQKDTEIMHVHTEKSEIELYTLNGRILTYLDMFLCKNGFLYKYDNASKCYYLAINKNKYQFWDTNRIVLNL